MYNDHEVIYYFRIVFVSTYFSPSSVGETKVHYAETFPNNNMHRRVLLKKNIQVIILELLK